MRIDDFPKRTWPERPKSDECPNTAEASAEELAAPASVEAALNVLNAYVSGRPVPTIRIVGVEGGVQQVR